MSNVKFGGKILLFAVALIVCHAATVSVIKNLSCRKNDYACSLSSTEAVVSRRSDGTDEDHHEWGEGLPPLSTTYISDALKPRHRFQNYEEYIHLQLKKTMNPSLRKLWTSRDWRRKVDVFSLVFQNLMKAHLLKSTDKSLCIAARVGQEVLALREVGVSDSIGVDLVASPPLVMKGDMHRLPFDANTFDFEFSNAFDHALFPALFASEVERTLKPGGIVALHVAVKRRPDKYSANDLLNVEALLHLFGSTFDVIHIKDVDAFGLDSEVVLRKRQPRSIADDGTEATAVKTCSVTKSKQAIINAAEPLITDEPKKPWLAFKDNIINIKYLSRLINIKSFRKCVYIDVGARSYSSSIGSWFVKRYPKQNVDFTIYAVEADKTFAKQYLKHKDVHFLPYAAWVRNETLVFGPRMENRAVEGAIGMGQVRGAAHGLSKMALGVDAVIKDSSRQDIHRVGTLRTAEEGLEKIQGLDFAEWLAKTVSKDDFVVMKMDIEGAEFDVLAQMLKTGAICLIDELFLECHYNRWQRTSPIRTSKYRNTYKECISLFQSLRQHGVLVHQWW